MGSFIDQLFNRTQSNVEDKLDKIKYKNVKFARKVEYEQILNNDKMTKAQKTDELAKLLQKL